MALVVNGVRSARSTFESVRSSSTTTLDGDAFVGTAGNGTVDPSVLTLGYETGAAGVVWSQYPRLDADLASGGAVDAWNLDVSARLAVQTGGTAFTYVAMGLRDASGASLLWMQVAVGSGVVDVFDRFGAIVATSAGTITFSGDEWFRVRFVNARLTVYLGTGEAGAQEWTPIYPVAGSPSQINLPAHVAGYTHLVFHVDQGSGAPSPVVVQWADVSVMRGT